MSPPGYQPVLARDIPTVALPDDAGQLRVIAGAYGAERGPARTFTPLNVWDMQLRGGAAVQLAVPEGHNTLAVVLTGQARIGDPARPVRQDEVAVLDRAGTELRIEAAEDATLLLLTGEPLDEPVVGYGPFVMNTRAQIVQAVEDFNSGKFGEMPAG
jgi:redox-sensitive bicupin YhaK (pirin superfamily)